MRNWSSPLFLFLVGLGTALGAPSTTATENATLTSVKSEHSAEVRIPDNMNVADYYYSIFGKHLDYDYKEPLLTFAEPGHNDLSDEIESEVDKTDDVWDVHSRKKRFILVPANFYNATRRWAQQMRRLRMERRRLRTERRKQWQQNRVAYLNARSEALRRQATRLSLQQQQKQQTTRNAPPSTLQKTTNNPVSIKPTESPSTPSSSGNLLHSESKSIPVKQVPLPASPVAKA